MRQCKVRFIGSVIFWHVCYQFDLLLVLPFLTFSQFCSFPGMNDFQLLVFVFSICPFLISSFRLQTPCTPPTACSSTTLARSPPPYFPPVWNHRVWPLNSKAEPVLPPTLQVTFLNRGNVRPDACCSYTPIFPRMFLGYVHVTMRPKRPDPHPPTQRLDDNQVEHWLCAENFNP